MSWEMLFVLGLLVLAFGNFVWEKISTDLTSFSVLAALLLASTISGSAHLPQTYELLHVFASPAPITIACMFVLSAALERCGVIDNLAKALTGAAKMGFRPFMLMMIFTVAITSAFINNTPVVVVLLPVVLSLSRTINVPSSKILIPLSYASILGGVCTAIGTSTNLLISGVLVNYEMEPLSMFELSSVGLPLLFCGATYLTLFGSKLLPVRDTLTSMLSEDERKEFITEAFVNANSELIGKSVKESSALGSSGARLIEIVRNGVALPGDPKAKTLQAGDRLILACRPSQIVQAHREEGVDFISHQGLDLEQIAAHQGSIVEGVIGPLSSLVGRTIDDVNFRQRYRMVLLAIHRKGRNVREHLHTLKLQFGDTLLMMGTDSAVENLRSSDDIFLLDRPQLPAKNTVHKKPLVVGILLTVIASVSFFNVPFVTATVAGVAALLLSRCVSTKEAYNSIEWSILMLIFGMLALGQAMEKSGVTAALSHQIIEFSNATPADIRPYVVLALLYVITVILTEMLTNNAVAVLMAPLGISLAHSMGVDPRPFIIAICIASSSSFSTPIGYQTNTYVYGVGGYKFSDFLRIGIPLNILGAVVSICLIPLFWSF